MGNNAAQSAGAAHVYRRVGDSWASTAYLKAANNILTLGGVFFGTGVAIHDNAIAVSALRENRLTTNIPAGIINGSDLSGANGSATESGAVYVFRAR